METAEIVYELNEIEEKLGMDMTLKVGTISRGLFRCTILAYARKNEEVH
jgi:hypothetical protein